MKRNFPDNGKTSIFNIKKVTETFQENGIKLINLQKLWKVMIKNGVELDSISRDNNYEIALKAIDLIKKEFCVSSKVIHIQNNSDGSTSKLLIEFMDGNRVESVIMRYGDVALDNYPFKTTDQGGEESDTEENDDMKSTTTATTTTTNTPFPNGRLYKSHRRATVCVSSQVGCAMGCTFCATGTMNLIANLQCGEILEQLYHANKVEKIRNVVFMGMGEPLDNYNAVTEAIGMMIDTRYYSLSPLHVTISTVGVVPRLLQLSKDLPQIGLALSLHAPTQELRMKIVPTSKAWPLEKIMAATKLFLDTQNAPIVKENRKRHVLVEYVLIADINDSDETAHLLGKLLQNLKVLLNVIPYNVTDVPHDYKPPTLQRCERFVTITREYGVHTLFRQKMGDDIASACGQLVIDKKEMGNCGNNDSVGDMEDLGKSKGSSGKAKTLPIKNKKGKKYEEGEVEFQVEMGKLNENIPGILVQYSILGLVCWGLYRWMNKYS